MDLDRLAESVAAAFDPTCAEAPARTRIFGRLSGLDPAQPLAPPEVCIGLDRPVWRDIEQTYPEWLLPGVNALPQDSVIALATNPTFIDALLLGFNGQLLSDLRWRNIAIATGCTPLRVFWDRAETQTGNRIDDVVGVGLWLDGSDLGAGGHRPGGASAADLVLVVRGQLFQHYPRTVIYLASAMHGAAADFEADPDPGTAHILPSFQGRIGMDVTFFGFQGVPATDIATHWVVLEEPPHGYRFNNLGEPEGQGVASAADGADWATATSADPVRVLIAGPELVP